MTALGKFVSSGVLRQQPFGAVRAAALRATLIGAMALALVSCQGGIDEIFPKAERPVPPQLVQKMKALGMKASSPILIRIYKQDNVLEVWKQKTNGRFAMLVSYEICKWSGKLGPKFKEGDRQAPEGFYRVGIHQMNPNSDYHLSFNIGYPNTFDRSHGRTGSHLMVHGACSSAGCYSMNDDQVEEIYSLARDALKGGQDYFQVQAYPFRMTAGNLAKQVTSEHFEFWKSLKEGSDLFEITNYPPKVDVCEKRYIFNRETGEDDKFSASAQCPPMTMPASLLAAYKEKRAEEQIAFTRALKRYQLRNGRDDPELAAISADQVSIAAAGSEVLPPPTPVAAPEPAPEAEHKATVAASDPAAPATAINPADPAKPAAPALAADSGQQANPSANPEDTLAAITASNAAPRSKLPSTGGNADGTDIIIPADVPIPQPAIR
ncbi:MAG: murein L,D-transpeptidase [Nitratireductor sp.]|nr:murein L,D-transpeptidase [Nitratireductor sp.]